MSQLFSGKDSRLRDFTHSHTTKLTQIMQTTAPITYNIFHLPCNSMELGNLFCKKFA